VIKVFLHWVSGYEEYAGCIKPSTLRSLAVPKLEQHTKPTLTADEINRLYEACKKEYTTQLVVRDIAILSVLLDIGVRASELCSLTLKNVHLHPQDSYIMVFGKGRKEREIGLGTKARLDLHRYIRQYRKHGKPDEAVFLSRYNIPLTRNGLDQILYRLKDWANVKIEGGAHLFRHTFATLYLINGDVYKFSRIMGHNHVTTTEKATFAVCSKEMPESETFNNRVTSRKSAELCIVRGDAASSRYWVSLCYRQGSRILLYIIVYS